MAIELTTLADLNATDVQSQLAVIVQLLQEANPTLDLRRGVLYDLLATYHAQLAELTTANLQRYISARSLLQIQADPTLADTDTVNDVLSNWRITRLAGSAATGQLTVELSAAVSVTIAAGTVFTANGYTFTADYAYTAKTSAALINSSTDRLLVQLQNGNWAFNVDVTATTIGAASLIAKNTLAVPASIPLNYVTSYATSDFSGGANPQTNADLLNQLLQGFSVAVPSNRITMAGMLTQQSEFAGVTNQSVIGAGDPEMLRDKHSILPLATGGRADWYVRSQPQAVQLTISKTATLLSVAADGSGQWQIEILRDDYPGFFEVSSVLPAGSTATGTLTLNAVIPGTDLSGPGFVPDIENVMESAFSYYQTAVVNFTDDTVNQSNLSSGATATYSLTLNGLPLIADMQAFVGDYDHRPYGADVLIKAPVPCFVDISVTIAKKRNQSDPDTSAIAAAVAAAVNAVDFVGRLYAGQLQAVIASYLTTGMSAGGIDMLGRIYGPDGIDRYVRSQNILIIPNLPAVMITPRTVQFFCDPSRVAVTVNTDMPVNV